MKVLVVNNAAPFVRGGAEELADNLTAQLNLRAGVSAELLRLPFNWEPTERLIDEILIAQSLVLYNVDRVIALKFPAYLIPHPEKVFWLLHQFRQAYDLGDVHQGLSDEGREGVIKGAIRTADNAAFAQARRIFVNSPITAGRLQRYNSYASEVLYPPLNDAHLFTVGEDAGYVFAGGRVAPGKRQHLLIQAWAKAGPSAPPLLIAGPVESEAYGQELREDAARLGLTDKIKFRFGFHPRSKIADWVKGARACAYLPYDEDSLGYVAMEAFAAGKPVLTTRDAGGLLEMVNNETGAVAAPEAHALAEALMQLASGPKVAFNRGAAAKASWDARGLTWDGTLDRLLS
jgi:glycosyltransferase involved in cell wall biosynthesis